MERLSDFAADIINDLYENSDWYGDYSLIEAAIDRLAAYEDILGDEYDLGRLRELAQADGEGQCGIPPVKLRQRIFRVFNGKVYEEIVCSATWELFTPRPRWKV